MPKRPIMPRDLWALPRVGAPVPSPDGALLLVPVTTYSGEEDDGRTRLWLVPADARRAGAGGRRDRARPLTSADVSASQPAWSPDGRAILFLRKPGGKPSEDGKKRKRKGAPRHPDRQQVYSMPVDGGEPERLTDLPWGALDPKWHPDGRRIAFLALHDIDGKRKKKDANGEDEPESAPESKPKVTEDRFYRMWDRWLTDARRHHLYLLDPRTRETMDLTPSLTTWIQAMDPTGSYDIAPDGRQAAFTACRSKPPHSPLLWGLYTVRIPARVREGARISRPRLVSPRSLPDVSAPRYSPSGRYLLHGVRRERGNWSDRTRLAVYDLKREAHTVLTEAWGLSAQEWTWADGEEAVYCTADVSGCGGLFALPLSKIGAKRSAGVPRELVRGGTFTAPRSAAGRIFLNGCSLGRPPEVISFGAGGSDRRVLTAFTAPLLERLELGRAQSIRFEGADGDEVQMWVVEPPQSTREGRKRKPPLVHLIHGGPHGAFGDIWHWRWNAQVFAAPGHLVAMVNFHGSSGWGQEFTSSIVGDWGDLPYRDVMAATHHLVRAGRVSPTRHAAGGGSFGGYLASWIAGQTDHFRCIVNHAGVCDTQTQMGCDIPEGWPRSAGGDVWSDLEGLDRNNPIRHAAGFRSPMLVLHGEKDYRVPYYQALQIYNVYKARGLEARLVCYPDENHWILKPKNSLHWYGEVLGWLERWL